MTREVMCRLIARRFTGSLLLVQGMSDQMAPARLGIGLLYQKQFRPHLAAWREHFDFLEVIPDQAWHDLGTDRQPRYLEVREEVDYLRHLSAAVPLVLHSIGLSIGSACRFDRAHVAQLARWYEWLQFPWHSDHLAFISAEHSGAEVITGVTLPLPYDQESIELLKPRIAEIRAQIPAPFLLENNVYFFQYPEQEFDEPDFLNRLCEASGCGLLLDLHNVYTNSRNHGTDPFEFLKRLDLSHVIEIHTAGGLEASGFYQDAHSDVSPPVVWQMLEWVLPRCPRLGGVVFELLGSWFSEVGEEKLIAQLQRMKQMWPHHRPATLREVA